MKNILRIVNRKKVLIIGPLIFLAVFYFYPMGTIFNISFSQLTLKTLNMVSGKVIGNALGFTFYQATLSTLLTLIVGLPAAYVFGRLNFAGKNILRIAATLPFILPTVVVAAAFSSIIGPQGWLNLLLMRIFSSPIPIINLQNTLGAILLAHVFYNTSIIIRVVGGAWAQMDIRLEEAARTLGASDWMVFRKVTLPVLLPSLISALLLVFLFDFTSFGVILMMGGPRFSTLEVEIFIQTMHFLNLPVAGILSLIQLIATMFVTFLIMRISNGEWNLTMMPRLRGEGQHAPKKIWDGVLIILTVFVLIALLIIPIVGLVIRSFTQIDANNDANYLNNWKISRDHYQKLFINQRQSFFYVPPVQALINSMSFALIAATISLIMGLALAFSNSAGTHLNRTIELIVLLPLGTSAVTLGLGFFTAFSTSPNAINFFPVLLPIAHALIALPFVLRVIQPALQSIPTNIKLAAKSLGAPPHAVWRHIELPIIWRALMTAAVYAFTISLGEFGATNFLARPELPTLPIAIYRYLTLPGSSNYGQAMAMAVILLFVCALSMLTLDLLQFDSAKKTWKPNGNIKN